MKYKLIHILELNDTVQQRLGLHAEGWKEWILTRRNVEEVALQLAAYESLALKYIDGDAIERQG